MTQKQIEGYFKFELIQSFAQKKVNSSSEPNQAGEVEKAVYRLDPNTLKVLSLYKKEILT